MKLIQIIITSSSLMLLSSCSFLGLHTSRDIKNEARRSYSRGLNAGKAISARADYLRQQEELSKPQPKAVYYNIPVPSRTSSDGVNFNSHTKPVQIFTK